MFKGFKEFGKKLDIEQSKKAGFPDGVLISHLKSTVTEKKKAAENALKKNIGLQKKIEELTNTYENNKEKITEIISKYDLNNKIEDFLSLKTDLINLGDEVLTGAINDYLSGDYTE